MLKKILPVIGGAVGFAIGGPMGAAIGSGLGSAARGDNPSNIATNALMGFGLGSFATSAGLFGSAATEAGKQEVIKQGATDSARRLAEEKAKTIATEQATKQTLGQKVIGGFKDMSPLTKGALGLGAIGALSSMEEEPETIGAPEQIEPGSQGMLNVGLPGVTYYDETTGEYGSSTPTYPTYRTLAGGGDVIDNFPRKVGQIDGPGTEKSDDIPAMLSDGEFVMTASAVRGLGALNGADKDDKVEQRRKGAKMMYDMMDKFESRVA